MPQNLQNAKYRPKMQSELQLSQNANASLIEITHMNK